MLVPITQETGKKLSFLKIMTNLTYSEILQKLVLMYKEREDYRKNVDECIRRRHYDKKIVDAVEVPQDISQFFVEMKENNNIPYKLLAYCLVSIYVDFFLETNEQTKESGGR